MQNAIAPAPNAIAPADNPCREAIEGIASKYGEVSPNELPEELQNPTCQYMFLLALALYVHRMDNPTVYVEYDEVGRMTGVRGMRLRNEFDA